LRYEINTFELTVLLLHFVHTFTVPMLYLFRRIYYLDEKKYSFVLSLGHLAFRFLLFFSLHIIIVFFRCFFFVAVLTSFIVLCCCASSLFLVAILTSLPSCCFSSLFSLLSSHCLATFFSVLLLIFVAIFSLPFLFVGVLVAQIICLFFHPHRYSIYSLLSFFTSSSLFFAILVRRFPSRMKAI